MACFKFGMPSKILHIFIAFSAKKLLRILLKGGRSLLRSACGIVVNATIDATIAAHIINGDKVTLNKEEFC